MRTIIFVTFMALLAAACTNIAQPVTAKTGPAQPESAGSHPNPEQQGNAFSISTEVYYQASPDSISSRGRVIGLSLTPKGTAEMTTFHLDKSPAIVDTGKWTTLNNGNLLLNLRRAGEKDSIILEFKTDGNKLVYTGSDYGSTGLVMWVKHLPESK